MHQRFAATSVFCLLALPAWSHIQLDSPTVRYPNGASPAQEVNKHCPCGGGPGTSTCSGGMTSDSNRASDRVSMFSPGETIVVEWRETIGHSGRYRIAFDPDGADLADFNAHILLDIPDPSGGVGNAGNGNRWRAEVTLPTTPCSNCTLQLLQVMNGDTVNAVANPIGMSTYFQCADIVIAEPASEGEGEGEGAGEGEGEGEGDEEAEGDGEGEGEGEGEGDGEGEGEGEAHGEGEGDGEGEEGAARPRGSTSSDEDDPDESCGQAGYAPWWSGLLALCSCLWRARRRVVGAR